MEGYVESFVRDGWVVVPDILDREGVERAVRGFDASLRRRGVDVDDLGESLEALRRISSAKGGVMEFFYEAWKVEATVLNERYAAVMWGLLEATYAGSRDTLWSHPMGRVEGLWAHVDRVGFRAPDAVGRVQRHLSPHLDCCPSEMYSRRRWRPIQCLVALSGGAGPDQGGFEAVRGFHREFDAYYRDRPVVRCVGDFSPVTDPEILRRFEHVPVPPGAALFWDRRVPHANARRNASPVPRRVIYGGFLPRGPEVNRDYAAAQLDRCRKGLPQPDFWRGDVDQAMTMALDDASLTDHGRRLLGIIDSS